MDQLSNQEEGGQTFTAKCRNIVVLSTVVSLQYNNINTKQCYSK